MKVPKYIEDALERRARAAESWEKHDRIVTEFIEKNSIDAPLEDYCGGVEAIVHPWDSARTILECIERKEANGRKKYMPKIRKVREG